MTLREPPGPDQSRDEGRCRTVLRSVPGQVPITMFPLAWEFGSPVS